ncbi:MAG: hypothetical protein U0441_23110 [Polyangiaceae bacterium]
MNGEKIMARRRVVQTYDDSDDSSGLGALVLLLFGFGSALIALDQHDKRKKEQEIFHRKLDALKTELAARQQELADLEARLGPKNEQVRRLSQEVIHLRAKLSMMSLGNAAA